MAPARPEILHPGVAVTADEVIFTATSNDGLVPTDVWLDARDFGYPLTFTRLTEQPALWQLRIPHPPVNRLEYLISWRSADGQQTRSADPANPTTVAGVFGEHSVVILDAYHPPDWLEGTQPASGSEGVTATPLLPARAGGLPESLPEFQLSDEVSGLEIRGALWSPAGFAAGVPLPLLVVHDGRELEQFGSLTTYLQTLAARRPELTCRALLLHPADRDRCYSANPDYAHLLTDRLLPSVLADVSVSGPALGLGVSLGAVAILQAALARPGLFAGVLLQSGSFFTDVHDIHEARFAYYDRVAAFTQAAAATVAPYAGLFVVMTCGQGEENRENNLEFSQRLAELGADVTVTLTPDAHNFTSWRDAWEPSLEEAMAKAFLTQQHP